MTKTNQFPGTVRVRAVAALIAIFLSLTARVLLGQSRPGLFRTSRSAIKRLQKIILLGERSLRTAGRPADSPKSCRPFEKR